MDQPSALVGDMAPKKNGPKEMMAFFSVPTKGICTDSPSDGKVTLPEFNAFWKELDDVSKNELRYMDLTSV